MLYRKATDINIQDVDPASSMTLMSADIERIVQGWQTMHELWAAAAEVGIAIFLLQKQLGVACVVPIAVSIRMYLPGEKLPPRGTLPSPCPTPLSGVPVPAC